MTTAKLDGHVIADAMPAAYDVLENDLLRQALGDALASQRIGLDGYTSVLAHELAELEALLRDEGPKASTVYERTLLATIRSLLAEREHRPV